MTNKQQTPQFIDEDDRKFYEGLRSMSDEDMLAKTRGMRDVLLAEDGKLARELGLSDADVEKFSADIATLEQAVETERLAAPTRCRNRQGIDQSGGRNSWPPSTAPSALTALAPTAR